jgi:hypothetical protein
VWFPRSLCSVRQGRCPAIPLQHRHAYAAGIQHGLATDLTEPASESTNIVVRCILTHIRQVGVSSPLEELWTLVHSHLHLLVLLTQPGTSGSAAPARHCQSCSHRSVRLHGSTALSFNGLLRQPKGGVLSSPHGNTAPRGARS